mgnify:CR=1 FL=1
MSYTCILAKILCPRIFVFSVVKAKENKRELQAIFDFMKKERSPVMVLQVHQKLADK